MVLLILLPPALVNFKSSSFAFTAFQSSFDIIITFFVGCYCLCPHWIPLHPMQSMHQTSAPLKDASNYLSNKWLFAPIGLRIKKLCLFLLRRCNLSRDISERAALKDFTITLHTDLQNSWFLMRWKVDLMELQNNLLFAHGTSLILDENFITTATLHRWWWSNRTIFLAGMLHTYCLNKQFLPKH